MKKFLLSIIFVIQKFTSRENLQMKAIKSLGLEQPLYLLDVGSAKGMPDRWKVIRDIIFSYGFEPDEGARRKLIQNEKKLMGGNIDYPYALSNEKKNVELNILKKPSHSSILEPNNDFINLFKKRHPEGFELDFKVNVEAIDLDSLDLKVKDFMKIDVQGYELKVLEGAKYSLKEILGLEIEVEFSELYKQQCSFGEIKDYLLTNGFEFVDFTSLTRWERDTSKNTLGLCMGGDALFLRTPEYVFSKFYNDNKKLNAYLAICLIYKRHDLISYILKLFKLEKKQQYLKFIKIHKILRRRLNITDRLARFFNHILRFFSGITGGSIFY